MNLYQNKILLADDHAVVRAGLVAVIKKYTPYTVVAEVGDGLETIEKARQHKPNLIILDIGMPGLNGLEAISQILKFEGEIIICWDHRESGESLYNGAGTYGYGYDHSYCLVYRNAS